MTFEELKADGFYYLASPYSDPDPEVRQQRVDELRMHQAYLMKKGLFVYPAVGATHDAATKHDMPKEFEYWHELNFTFINASEGMIICAIKGWRTSRGVIHEIGLCREMVRPIWLFDFYYPTGPRIEPYA